MTRFRLVLALLLLALPMFAQTPQTPGQIRPRPAQGRDPEWPAPTIREYKPHSTMVVPQHPTPRAKFPTVDIHSHHPTPISPEQYAQVGS